MKRKLSFENAHRLIEQGIKINDIIRESVFREIYENESKAIQDVNKAVYEMAQKQGISIWDVCFHFIPEFRYPEVDMDYFDPRNVTYTAKTVIDLVPVEFELEKGPDYWEEKYSKLKLKMQAVLDDENGES